jgi:putative flavoprotein involved in K+ transport
MPFPAPPSHLPDKDEVADYLERYAERFELPVRSETRVDALAWDGARHVVRAGERRLEAANVIVATGPFQRPRVPEIAARLDPGIVQLHSSGYRSPFDLPDGPALVVGVGNSGAQIALELARFRRVHLAGRETGHLPRRVLGRDIYDWIWPLLSRAHVGTRLGRRIRERARRGDPLVGIAPRAIAAGGVERLGRLTDVRGGVPVCEGVPVDARVVVWCTGFAPEYGWIDLPVLDESGSPRHRRGVALDAPGLYFLGLRFQHTMTSALIGGVGSDAAYIAARVAAREEAALVG